MYVLTACLFTYVCDVKVGTVVMVTSSLQKVLMQITQELCKRPGLNRAGFEMPTIFVPSLTERVSSIVMNHRARNNGHVSQAILWPIPVYG